MGARIGAGRAYPAGEEPNGTGPWVATSNGVAVRMSANWGPLEVVAWLKLHFPEALLINVTDDNGDEYKWRFKGEVDPAMSPFLDRLSVLTYGRSRSESIRQGICVDCGKDASGVGIDTTGEGLKEYMTSGLCLECQLKVFGPN